MNDPDNPDPEPASVYQYQRCIRCHITTIGLRLSGSTCMFWPMGVDYLDEPEPANHRLWICQTCWERKGMELYLPAYGFHHRELLFLQFKYDQDYRREHNVTDTSPLN